MRIFAFNFIIEYFEQMTKTDYIFSVSWEVCNKVGGIYTVLSTQANEFQKHNLDKIIYIGPDLYKDEISKSNSLFIEDKKLLPKWQKVCKSNGIKVRLGRWNIPGNPIVALVNFQHLFAEKDKIYGKMWEDFNVDSLHAYGDYDEACMFSYCSGLFVEAIVKNCLPQKTNVVFQAHEWMSGFGLLYVKKNLPAVGTVFTTHATSIGRSITSNNKPLYDYFKGYFGDQMARELNMEAKHSIEKKAAQNADCMTTVSEATDKECVQFLERKSDVILMNGFDGSFVPKGSSYTSVRKKARKKIIEVANALIGTRLGDDVVIMSTSGRNDFRCKGFDVLLSAVKRVQENNRLAKEVLLMIAVPCWKKGPREDLIKKINDKDITNLLPEPYITHELYNFDYDNIVNTIKYNQIKTDSEQKLHFMFIPSYLDGNDGIFDLQYYDWLVANDFCIYPSYYEPWGYTCHESLAFGIPCLTTNLTGFGQWVNRLVGHKSSLKDGVEVIDRNDSNYVSAVDSIAKSIEDFVALTPQEIKAIRRKASNMAKKAMWDDFINNYLQAFSFALENKNK